jgi:riboflavin kinase/FMN adenylyltransferase
VRIAVTNVGVRPTVGGEDLTVESFILDYAANLYGKLVRLEFHAYLRPECRFGDIGQLKDQIKKDVQCAREYFGASARG